MNESTVSVESRPLLLVSEAAARLGLSRTMVYSLIDRGDLPVVRFGKAVRIDPFDLDALVERRKGTRGVGA